MIFFLKFHFFNLNVSPFCFYISILRRINIAIILLGIFRQPIFQFLYICNNLTFRIPNLILLSS